MSGRTGTVALQRTRRGADTATVTAHPLPPTTRTMELAQVAQLNDRLGTPGTVLTASDLGLDAPAGVALAEVVLEGSPSYGYLWGLFRAAGGDAVRVLLHTDHLRALSRAVHLPHHHWGV